MRSRPASRREPQDIDVLRLTMRGMSIMLGLYEWLHEETEIDNAAYAASLEG